MLVQPPAPRFEVSALRDKRWIIDCLAPNEAAARARAEEIFADDSIDAVRVVRGRFGRDGTSYESVILEQARGARRGPPPVRIAATPDEVGWCETLDDLYGTASRRAIARVLRNFLDRLCITPTELLHHHRYIKQLERQNELMSQAVQRIAAQQARAGGQDGRARLDLLDRLVTEASTRARDAATSRAAPQLGEGGLAALAAAVAESAREPSDQAFLIRLAVSHAFEELGDFGQKLAALLAWEIPAGDAGLPALVDELCAGLFGAASLLQEVLGPQPHLGAALATLARLIAGDTADPPMPPLAASVAKLLSRAPMPETRLVLLERVQRELASDKPLSRDDAMTQRRLFETLVDRLMDEHGLYRGGIPMVEAFARRSRGYGIVGGIENPRFTATEPQGRLEPLVKAAEGVIGERQQRALATCLAEVMERCEPGVLAPLSQRIAALTLPAECKTDLIERLRSGKN